jgi:hypothetical protein
MAGLEAFDQNAKTYDQWFERHPRLYEAELLALRALAPPATNGIEIGVGTGRYRLKRDMAGDSLW